MNDCKTPLVLVVDDQALVRRLLCRAMIKEGYQVIEADDGEPCLALCEQQLPDIVLLDAMMPTMDGFTCCAALQARWGEQCPPILMITALDQQESVDRAFEVGATDYVTKPVHWAVLRQRVRRLLQTHWAMNEMRSLTAQLESANQKLQRLAFLDSLTQIANRRYFDETLGNEWRRLIREQAPISLILWDIDYFKFYNDTYGHPAGDRCLKQVASLIHQGLRRPADVAARYGGEEFAAILPNTPIEGAIRVAENIQKQLKAQSIPNAQSPISEFVTVSAGVAGVVPLLESSPADLLAATDQALYRAKAAGRDRIVCHSLFELISEGVVNG